MVHSANCGTPFFPKELTITLSFIEFRHTINHIRMITQVYLIQHTRDTCTRRHYDKALFRMSKVIYSNALIFSPTVSIKISLARNAIVITVFYISRKYFANKFFSISIKYHGFTPNMMWITISCYPSHEALTLVMFL